MKRIQISAVLLCALLWMPGCDGKDQSIPADDKTVQREETGRSVPQDTGASNIEIANYYRDIYERAAKNQKLHSPETTRAIVACLGEAGYAAVDYNNQVDMVNADQAVTFAGHVEQKETAELTILCVTEGGGFVRYDLETAEGEVKVEQSSLGFRGETPEVLLQITYPAYDFVYAEDGYLFFEQQGVPGLSFGQTAIRVQPLPEKNRELNRRFLMPVGYGLSNLFSTEWSEDDWGTLSFYDLYELLYQNKNGRGVPYPSTYEGTVYEIPEGDFEAVVFSRFAIDQKTLREKTTYLAENGTYEYRPRGLYDSIQGSEIPYPEVISYTDNEDQTITITAAAVWPKRRLTRALLHQVTIRPLADGEFQYVSNHIIPGEDSAEPDWYTERLTKEQWEEFYKSP